MALSSLPSSSFVLRTSFALVVCASLLATGCGRRGSGRYYVADAATDGTTVTDLGSGVDAGIRTDAGVLDSGTADLGVTRDLGVVDMGGAACGGYAHVSGSCETPADGDLAVTAAGLLAVYHLGVWQGVCDDNFGEIPGAVACAQFGAGFVTWLGSQSGPSDAFWLDGFTCDGTEAALASCPNSGWGIEDCSSSEWVSLTCAW